MLRLTNCSALTMSSSAKLPESSFASTPSFSCGRFRKPRMPSAIVRRHDDGVGGLGERGAVVDGIGGVARDVAAAVNEDDHRQAARRRGRSPDVQIQAIFAAHRLVQRRADRRVVAVVRARAVDATVLRARIAELLCGLWRRPMRRDRRAPSSAARRSAASRTARPSMHRCRSRPSRRCRQRYRSGYAARPKIDRPRSTRASARRARDRRRPAKVCKTLRSPFEVEARYAPSPSMTHRKNPIPAR